MKGLRNYLNKIKPNFEKGGRLHALHSFFDGMETFMFVPHTTSRTGTNIHDAIDSKRIMILVVIALACTTSDTSILLMSQRLRRRR